MNPVIQALVSRAAADPSIANNPNSRAMLEVLQTGDSKRGEQIANNLLNTYGVTKGDAVRMAREFFHL